MTERPYHHGNLRRALLDKAFDLFGQRGDLHFSFRELARHTGVTHSAPYRHFANKAELIDALVGDGLDRLARSEQTALARAGTDHRERIRSLGEAYIRFALQNPSVFRLVLSGSLSKSDEEIARGAESYRVLDRTIRDAQRAGVVRQDMKSRDLALGAWTAVHGAASLLAHGRLSTTEASVRHCVWVLSTMFFEGADSRTVQPRPEA